MDKTAVCTQNARISCFGLKLSVLFAASSCIPAPQPKVCEVALECVYAISDGGAVLQANGFSEGTNTVTLFPGEGPRTLVDQISREPESLARSIAATLRTMYSPKMALAFDVVVIVSPEHARIFREAGWSKDDLRAKLHELTLIPGSEIVGGALGIAEGLPESVREHSIPKFRPDGLHIVHAGGGAGLFSAIIAGWANGEMGSQIVTQEIKS